VPLENLESQSRRELYCFHIVKPDMSSRFPANLLAQLEPRRYRFDPREAAHILKVLTSLGAAQFPDARSLIRFHEPVLFLRAFPQGPSVGP
jgi:hypothetical protein